MTSFETDWRELEALTDAMVGAAQSGAWDEVARLEQRRGERLRAFFDNPGGTEAANGALRPRLDALLERDRELIALGSRARDEIAQQLRRLRQGRQARKAYGQGP